MTRLTGYARQEAPKWLSALIVVIVLLAIVLIFWGFSAVYNWLENKGSEEPVDTSTTITSTTIVSTTVIPVTTTLRPAKEAAVSLPVKDNSGLKVEAITFSSGIDEANQPVDQLESVNLKETGTLYCFTRISGAAVPQKIKHVWLAPDGHVVAEIELTLRTRPAVTYSYVSLSGGRRGRWQFQVRTMAGAVVARKDFLAN